MKELSFERMEEVHGGKLNGCDYALLGVSVIWGSAITFATGGVAAILFGAAWTFGTAYVIDKVCHPE